MNCYVLNRLITLFPLIVSQVAWSPGYICTATCRRLPRDWKAAATNATHCAIKTAFFGCRSIGDWSVTTIPRNRRPVGDRSATGARLIANWLEMGCDWSASGWRLVGDRSAMGWRLTIDQTICCVCVIMNKALIDCYSMAISISIMSYCLFFVFIFRLGYTYFKTIQRRQSIINHDEMRT